MDTLITGGSGLLGQALKKYFPHAHFPSHQELDVADIKSSSFCQSDSLAKIKTIVHCAAIKNTECSKNPLRALKVNIVGTANMAMLCHEIRAKLVYISTDYVFKGDKGDYKITDEVMPVNYYGETKLAGEYAAKSVSQHLIVRLSFFPDVFPYDNAFFNQVTTRITVSEAAKRIYKAIEEDRTGIIHIAGDKQTSHEFACSTANGRTIIASSIDLDCYSRPIDTSLVEG